MEVMPMDDPATRKALWRYGVIAPLLAPDLERHERARLKQQVVDGEHSGPGQPPRRVSERTIERWLKRYREQGFAGLMPRPRKDSGTLKALDPEVLQRAVALREEAPERSTQQIIRILALDPEKPADGLALSTLSRHLRRLGKNRARLKASGKVFRRYEKDRPNAQWQSDVLYGPHLPDPADPAKHKRTYLIAFLDDHSRLVPHGAFYWAEDLVSLLDCFKRAILKRGIPTRVYCDQGAIYQSRQFGRICAELAVRHIAAKPYSPEGKGKIERFWQNVESSFLTELRLDPVTGLEELNRRFGAWLEQGYHHWQHREIGDSPSARFARALDSIRLPDPVRVREIFLWAETRTVDRTGCVKLQGNRYEVDSRLTGLKVQLRYDPYDLSSIEVWHDQSRYPDAIPAKLIRERDHRVPEPPRPAQAPRTGLNYLKLLLDKHQQEAQAALGRIPFRNLKEDEQDV
jgi:putative transposase